MALVTVRTRAEHEGQLRGRFNPRPEKAKRQKASLMNHPLSVTRIGAYIAFVVVSTAIIVVLIHALFGSWADGGIIGALATGLSVAGYAVLVARGSKVGGGGRLP